MKPSVTKSGDACGAEIKFDLCNDSILNRPFSPRPGRTRRGLFLQVGTIPRASESCCCGRRESFRVSQT
jgi:hypothetical protein